MPLSPFQLFFFKDNSNSRPFLFFSRHHSTFYTLSSISFFKLKHLPYSFSCPRFHEMMCNFIFKLFLLDFVAIFFAFNALTPSSFFFVNVSKTFHAIVCLSFFFIFIYLLLLFFPKHHRLSLIHQYLHFFFLSQAALHASLQPRSSLFFQIFAQTKITSWGVS